MALQLKPTLRGKFNTAAQGGFGLFDQPLSTQASIFGPLVGAALPLASSIFDDPANIRGARRFFSGDTSPATNEFFKPQEMDLIKEAARGALAENRDYLNYGDWDRAAGRPWMSVPDPKNWSALLDKVRDPAEIMQTTLGGVGGYISGPDTAGGAAVPEGTPDIHYPGLGIINKPVGPTGRYNEPHLTLRDVWDVNPGGQPSNTNPFYQALLNLGEHRTTTQGSEFGFPFDLDLGLASDYDIPYMSLDGEDRYELQDWENQSPDWYVPRYPTKEAPPAVTWGEGNILQRARNPNLSAVSQALTPTEIMKAESMHPLTEYVPEESKTYVQEALNYINAGESEQEEQVQEIRSKPREERSSVEEQVVVASKVRKALDNAAKGKKVKNEFQAITELAKTDPTIARRYTTPGSQDLIDITSQVESFASINKPRPGYGKPPRRPGGR